MVEAGVPGHEVNVWYGIFAPRGTPAAVIDKISADYIRQVKNLAAFLGRSPDTATAEDLRLYQLHLTQSGVRPPTTNAAVSALRFFFSVTLDRPEVTKPLTFVAEPRKIPVVLSPEEVARLLEAAPGPKYKAALSAAYGAGLRVSEVVALEVGDVDFKRISIDAGQVHRDQESEFCFVDVRSRCPVRAFKFISGAGICLSTSLRSVFKEPVHPILQRNQNLIHKGGIRTASQSVLLRAPHLRRRHHLHRFRDLGRVPDRFDAAPDVLRVRHG